MSGQPAQSASEYVVIVNGWRCPKLNAEIAGPFDIPEYPLEHSLVVVVWSMHVETHLLHGVSDVRACDGQVLQRPSNAPVCGRVGEETLVCSGGLWFRVGKSGDDIATCHASTLEEVGGVLGLRQEEARLVPVNTDAEEVLDWTHVLKCEGVLQVSDDLMKEAGG